MWRVTNSKMWSLGTFRRPSAEYKDVKFAFTHWLAERIESNRVIPREVGVRAPWNHSSIYNRMRGDSDDVSAMNFHHDGRMNRYYLVVWSNTVGTEICKVGDRENVYQPAPNEVVMFDNDFFLHKEPEMTLGQASRRWFARASIPSQDFVRDVPGVYRYLT